MAFWYSVRLSRRKVVGPAGFGLLGGRTVERAFEQGDDRVVLAFRRSHLFLRRHLASDELPHDLLPRLRVPAHVFRTNCVEGQAGRPVVAVMARDAVSVHEPTKRLVVVRACRGGQTIAVLLAGAGTHESDSKQQDQRPREAPRSPPIHEAWPRHQRPINEIDEGLVRAANDLAGPGKAWRPGGTSGGCEANLGRVYHRPD